MPAILSGIPRKVALATLSLTGIGWLLVVVGFGVAINKSELFLPPLPNSIPDQNDPNSYLYWSVCIAGPVMILAAATHAVLWQPFSSIVGAVASLLMVLFLTGLGMILNWNGTNIRDSPIGTGFPYSFKLEFAGAIVATFFSTLTMILWHFYDYELLKSTGTSFLRGIARKVALPFIFLTGVGWLLVVIGFAIAIHDDGLNNKVPDSYLYWVVSIGGPFTIMAAFAHAFLSKYPTISSAIGALTSFLSVFFLTGLGMMLYSIGVLLRITNSSDYRTSFKLMFSGSIIATTSFTAVLILWHFYDFEEKRDPDTNYSNIDLQAKRQSPPQPQTYGHTDL